MLFILNKNSNTNLKFTIMKATKTQRIKIENLVKNGQIKESIIYAQSKGISAEEFGKIAGKFGDPIN